MTMTRSSSEWTDDVIAKLRLLWKDGFSTAEIGRRLGVSKNAVIGKAHRLHLPTRASPIRRGQKFTKPKPARRTRAVPRLADILPLRSAPPVAQAVPAKPPPRPRPEVPVQRIARATGFAPCCWPVGHPGAPGFHFCERFALIGKPYCEMHCDLAYARPKRGQDDDAGVNP